MTLTVLLFAFGGVLLGGVASMTMQRAPKPVIVMAGLLAVASLVAGLLRLYG